MRLPAQDPGSCQEGWSPSTESGLQACYGNPCKCRGFYLGVHPPCIARAARLRRREPFFEGFVLCKMPQLSGDERVAVRGDRRLRQTFCC